MTLPLRMTRLLISLMLTASAAACASGPAARADGVGPPPSPEIAYLEQVNAWRPSTDPQLIFILMGQYANAAQHARGIAYFSGLLERFGARLSNAQRAQYLTAIASLRAQHADDVFLLRRIGYVRDTLAMLDEANRLTGSTMFVARWMSGVVRSQVPTFLNERDRARADLRWCLENAASAPHANWLREVHFALARIGGRAGNDADGARELALSGFKSLDKPVLFTTPFSGNPRDGHRFSPLRIREAVPGTVYLLSGIEFTEYYFIVSRDRRELIAIDAGTRADFAKSALDALRAQVPELPPLTTVFVTHAHWDHVGGQRYFREAFPGVKFIGRENFRAELANDASAGMTTLRQFFGERFSMADVLGYRPDVLIDRPTERIVGGTRFALIPTRGGETDDAMLIHMPDAGVLFVGDILMPYLGAPFVEEGSIDGLLESIDQIHALAPRLLLHGHEPLTRIFTSADMLDALKIAIAWLRTQVDVQTANGKTRAAVQQMNLVAPSLANAGADVHLAYLVMRENLINRRIDQRQGYWRNGLEGLDHLSDADRGSALADYLGITEQQIADAATRMISDGRHELAAAVLRNWRARHPAAHGLDALYREANLRLMDKYQEFNPFKFILYGAQAGQETAQMRLPPASPAPAR